MRLPRSLVLLLLSTVVACGQDAGPGNSTVVEVVPESEVPVPGLYDLRAVGMTFEGETEIPSGWTTFRFTNASPMIHFAMVDVPPAHVTMDIFSRELMQPFQVVMDAMNAGDDAAVEAAFATFPEWVGDLGRNGGPGLLSPGLTGETTVFMAPGRYVLECYVKSNGIFHTTSPGDGLPGMVLEFTVTEADNGAPEPEANATLELSNSSIDMVAGELVHGTNVIRVNYLEQQALPSFVGNDVHLLKVESDNSIALASDWMDWRTPTGLQAPSPVTFLGGVQDLPAGGHAYFKVELVPGDYAFMAEVPDPLAMGLVLPVSVAAVP